MWRVCGHHADAEKEVQVAGRLRWGGCRVAREEHAHQHHLDAFVISNVDKVQKGYLSYLLFSLENYAMFGLADLTVAGLEICYL